MERLTLPPGGAAAVDEYLEYRRIVGEDDGGKLFTPEEYEEYKRKVLPMRLQNRLFVSWRSPTGVDCKLVGPETLCFCTHRYKQHKTDFEAIPQQRPISLPCRVTGCPCRAYLYVPLNGAQPVRCRCKHFADQHSAAPGFTCNACSKCSGFHSCFTCACGQPAYAHDTVVETKQERLAQGKPVGRDVPYAAMGGLTGFSSLAEGYIRLDDSGIGAPSIEFLDSPVAATDHPFLRVFQASSSSSPETLTDGNEIKLRNTFGFEDVVGSHVEDAVTFWAQSISRNKDIMKISCSLSEVCPHANSVFGTLDPKKVSFFLVQFCISISLIFFPQCLVRYIDYGNTEILKRSDIVEIPLDLQFSSVAKKYRLWGLQIPSGQEVTQFDQARPLFLIFLLMKGRTFLGSLIFEKEIKMRIKATYQDGTVIAQAEYGSVDIGEEVAKKGFAEKCKLTSSTNISEEKKSDPGPLVLRNLKSPIPLWGHRSNQSAFSRPKGRLSGKLALDLKNENVTGNHMTFPKENLAVGDFNLGSNVSLAKIKQDQKLIEENEKLKTEKEVLLERYMALELKVEQTAQELQQEKATMMDLTKHLESTLKTHVGTRMKNLAAKVELLKEIRRVNISVRFGNDLSNAIQVLEEDCFTTPASLNELELIWAEYSLAQEKIQTCQNMNEGTVLIAKRNEVQQKLYVAVEAFILEVDELPVTKRLKTLQILRVSVFANEAFDLSVEESLTEDTIDNIDEILEKTESSVCKELEISLIEQGAADKEIISNTYSQVLQKIHSEERLIASVQSKYKDSVEFKKQITEYLNKSPNVDHLLSIKKTLKSLKARLRWKLVEKNNLEEARNFVNKLSDDHDESEIEKIKQEVTQLRSSVFQEIYHEQEEYEKLNSLVQKWFPELPLLHPEIGLLKYMNSGGLLTMSLERDLLDAEPMKELSSKRPLVCSEVDGQIILLKGYSVDVDTEARVIQRAAAYHRAWREAKKESGLLPLMFLFLCKSDPMAYLMVPYYPMANLSAVQASMPLTSEEVLKVMKGVAQGLHTLHKAGIIHGSLHQNNVFALNREQGIVGDFDFTKSVSQRASVNMMVGDLSLLSPELKMGKPASPSSDLYAYGCLLLWLSVQNQEFETNEEGIPKVDQFHLDDNVRSLLCSLIYCRSSVTAEEVVSAECFVLPKETSSPNSEEDTEYSQKKEEEELKVESSD
ncbi:Serine/threonine-protein kinase 31 [Camelus dromedarius]|uniref:Protein FAM221A n=1 Tax=Camelus dromedarius TaxID=9838 RepID=A0A5N4DY34_CAMDR|nr:Serine/threonine-protein kinase 31 [Camelus dromedarius]